MQSTIGEAEAALARRGLSLQDALTDPDLDVVCNASWIAEDYESMVLAYLAASSVAPSPAPTAERTAPPSSVPSTAPTSATPLPTALPSPWPTLTYEPTTAQPTTFTATPTIPDPSAAPSAGPTISPTLGPTTLQPTTVTLLPTISTRPTFSPTMKPTRPHRPTPSPTHEVTSFVYLAQLLEERCTECVYCHGSPSAARYGTCIDRGNNTCYAADQKNDCEGRFEACEQRGDEAVTDIALTSGACKRYSNALSLQYGGAASLSACGDDIVARVIVTNGGNISFDACGPEGADLTGDSSLECIIFNPSNRGGGGGEQRYLQTEASAPVRDISVHTLRGTPGRVAAALGNFTFCPECVGATSVIRAYIADAGKCAFDPSGINMTITASSAFTQVVSGVIIDPSSCDQASECWRNYVPNVTLAVTIGGPGCTFVEVQTDENGAYEIDIPYPADLHLDQVVVEVSHEDYYPSNMSVTLGAVVSEGSESTAIFAWVTTDNAPKGYCERTASASWTNADDCVLAGADLCAARSAELAAAGSPFASYCQCFTGTGKEPRGICSRTDDETSVCAGCLAGTSGPCQDQATGACYNVSGDAGSCMHVNDTCTGYPCLCATALGANIDVAASISLTPTVSLTTSAPTAKPTTLSPSLSMAPSPAPEAAKMLVATIQLSGMSCDEYSSAAEEAMVASVMDYVSTGTVPYSSCADIGSRRHRMLRSASGRQLDAASSSNSYNSSVGIEMHIHVSTIATNL